MTRAERMSYASGTKLTSPISGAQCLALLRELLRLHTSTISFVLAVSIFNFIILSIAFGVNLQNGKIRPHRCSVAAAPELQVFVALRDRNFRQLSGSPLRDHDLTMNGWRCV